MSSGNVTRVSLAALRRPIAVFFLAIAVTCVGLAGASAQTQAFTSVEIQGNQRVDGATILTFAGISRGQVLTAGELNDAYQNVVDSGLFEQVEFVPQGSKLVIIVTEYPTINIVNFEGNRRLADEDLETLVRSKSRRVYSPSLAEADAAVIADAYREAGRLSATVEPKIIRRSDNRVDLVFEVTEGRVIEVERVSFVGNRRYSDRRLRGALETKQAGIFRQLVRGDTLVEDRIEFDKQLLRDFYLARGFIDFQVLSAGTELTRDRSGFLLTFNVREGQQFRVGEVSVFSDIDTIDSDEYLNATRMRTGQVYSPTLVERDIARLERLAVQQGENFIRIQPRITRNDRDLTLDVELVVERGPRVFVERIDIEGNNTTLDRVVRRQFRVVEGDPFNPREIRQSAERIRALGYFTEANVEAREGTAPDQVIVDVDVEEAPTGSLGFGASYSTDSGFGFNISFSERNFLGRGQSLNFGISTTSTTQGGNFSFFEPAFLGRDVGFGIDVAYTETDNDNSDYNTRVGRISPSLSFPLNETSRVSVRATARSFEIFDVDPTNSSAILVAEDALGAVSSFSFGYTYSYDTRRTGLNPDAGVLLRFSQDFGSRSGASFVRSEFLARGQRKLLNRDVTLRADFEAGLFAASGGNSLILERFNLNGKIRGFENNGIGPRDLGAPNQDALGGNIFAVARLEAEFPLGLPEEYGITGGLFYDIGSVWDLDNTAGTAAVDDSMHLRSAIGFSIFWDTPIGPLRFNFSNALQKQSYDEEQSFELTIQTEF